jgi:uncharacterized membrane protein YedE/YeeE
VKANLAALLAGLLFAAGLAVGGMTQPSKVIGFLDVAGAWDASLAFVMAGAVAVSVLLRPLIVRRGAPLFELGFRIPTVKRVDARLVAGAATFGVGWGLVGYCPGPALASCATGSVAALTCVAGMAVGMLAYHAVQRLAPPEVAGEDDPVVRVTAA